MQWFCIKISFILRQSGGEAAAKASPAPPLAELGEQTPSSKNFEFVASNIAVCLEQNPTCPSEALA